MFLISNVVGNTMSSMYLVKKKKDTYDSLSKYKEVSIGMTEDEVVEIMGKYSSRSESATESGTKIAYKWGSNSSKSVEIVFVDSKVAEINASF